MIIDYNMLKMSVLKKHSGQHFLRPAPLQKDSLEENCTSQYNI